MKLSDFHRFERITIQCHDNPDADALASGFGLYLYYRDQGKKVRLVYSGQNRIQKANLVLMVNELKIPIQYIAPAFINVNGKEDCFNYPFACETLGEESLKAEEEMLWRKGLWITVDCQYGAGNVTKIPAENVAIIDHHQTEIDGIENSIIRSDLGSCATLVWSLLKEENYPVGDENGLGTALYYGLFTDTNQLAEIFNPLDRDMVEQIPYTNSLITRLRNSNITLNELEVAGVALLRYSFNEEYGFAVIRSQPCDPNILGLISDFLLQVDRISTCVVFNKTGGGYKLSVRSCVPEVNASELAGYLTKEIGSGGGHYEKAGGFINENLYIKKYPGLHMDGYINNRMTQYFDNYEIIHAKDYCIDTSAMDLYQKKRLPLGFVRSEDVLPKGTPITVRSLEGDMDLVVEEDLYIMIGIKGEVYPKRKETFLKSNEILNEKYDYDKYVISNTYIPTVKNRMTGQNHLLSDYAGVCVPSGSVKIFARKLTKGVKIFTAWDKDKYMLGNPGDYLAVRCDDLHDIYIIEEKIFGITYESVEE